MIFDVRSSKRMLHLGSGHKTSDLSLYHYIEQNDLKRKTFKATFIFSICLNFTLFFENGNVGVLGGGVGRG